MIYRTYVPRPPLSKFVELFWSHEGYDPPHAKERIFPTGTMQLIVNLREDEIRTYDRRDARRFRRVVGPLVPRA